VDEFEHEKAAGTTTYEVSTSSEMFDFAFWSLTGAHCVFRFDLMVLTTSHDLNLDLERAGFAIAASQRSASAIRQPKSMESLMIASGQGLRIHFFHFAE
jgi:hypothetical protein